MITVSIHVPLAEHDELFRKVNYSVSWFQFTCPSRSTTTDARLSYPSLVVSIHVPLAEHDLQQAIQSVADEFQFTCPSRSTTDPRRNQCVISQVSIHVPLAEHD